MDILYGEGGRAPRAKLTKLETTIDILRCKDKFYSWQRDLLEMFIMFMITFPDISKNGYKLQDFINTKRNKTCR